MIDVARVGLWRRPGSPGFGILPPIEQLTPATLLESTESAEERKAPKVSFS